MCQRCDDRNSSIETRASFLKKLAAGATLAAGGWSPRRMLASTVSSAPGSGAAWGRLITPHPLWDLHIGQDLRVAAAIRKAAGSRFDATVYTVNPAEPDTLAAFPFLFTNDLTQITAPKHQANLKEYLKRGGFFYVDGCLDHRVTRDFGPYLARHAEYFQTLVPGARVQALPSTHPIFRSYLPVKEEQLGLVTESRDPDRWKGAPQALYGVFDGERMISVVSLDHLMCEWLTRSGKVADCLGQIVNIYVFAMTR